MEKGGKRTPNALITDRRSGSRNLKVQFLDNWLAERGEIWGGRVA